MTREKKGQITRVVVANGGVKLDAQSCELSAESILKVRQNRRLI